MADVMQGTIARIYYNGAMLADGIAFDFDETHEMKNAPTTLGGARIKPAMKAGGYVAGGSFSGVYTEGAASRAVLAAAVRSTTALTVVLYWEGTAAGDPTTTFSALFGALKHGIAEGGESQPISATFHATTAPVDAPNLALSTEDFGSVAAGGAASGFNDPTASGGTSTYAITMEDENAVTSALPEGVSWSGSAFTGTVDAGANVGMYRLKVKVVDSAATPVTKYFLATMRVTA